MYSQVWSEHLRKWLHVDSCECAIDAPLVYESGWGKQLSWVVAAGIDEVRACDACLFDARSPSVPFSFTHVM